MTGPSRLLVLAEESVDADGSLGSPWFLAEAGRWVATGVTAPGEIATGPAEARAAEVIRARRVTPGLVDLHVHGGGGHAHGEDPAASLRALQAHHAHGTTRSLASLVSAPLAQLERSLAELAQLCRGRPWLLGAHLEGPFLARERRGAHRAADLRDPTPAAVAGLLDAADGSLRQVTLDPVRAGAAEAQRMLLGAGVVVAVGHTGATYDEASAAFDGGASLLTHAFNAMPGLHHRDPGPIGAALGRTHVALELILDGHHVHPTVACALVAAAPGRVAMVSDAMAAAAMPDGLYELGGQPVVVAGGAPRLSGSGVLAGSTLTLDRVLRAGLDAGLDVAQVVAALTLVPARALGIDGVIGRLAVGQAADFVTWDDDWRVTTSWCAGERLYPT